MSLEIAGRENLAEETARVKVLGQKQGDLLKGKQGQCNYQPIIRTVIMGSN